MDVDPNLTSQGEPVHSLVCTNVAEDQWNNAQPVVVIKWSFWRIDLLVQLMGARIFRPADHTGPAYECKLRKAVRNCVEVLAYDVTMDLRGIELRAALPFRA